ncbi:MAG: ferrous iron transport protein B [Candidatus Altiarchaeum hamiconexum]|uniref:Ferrous iron transport protein B n=1 Tax=Candidatus Altarchaeum hamiconexum TaxID=1803513 RepID=A0A8J7YYJ2_9ARCH|nr:ferrous iron transport protein B [Candidatus Altarchaeum hamiconexum]PIN67688.1 MAG: ferrous iron transport protein B [Candidatus Altarchaeum sp. CG12_big_fil_rev_8_21_14_0_65_33_22]PIV27872.1 MAG: ferrous iron transport protein B [Candidatus Altarchaeum sp. CG03_land_8_20_14_0_80_32_618]PIX48975.1 MAG: ferrous iron transport protein B [Candidatus Altarchaeum sp. CG_4_8_14_3_um_filter_33_2054]PIZ32727.1 MAG: ferrous iron transport protein B [Candidatus Altarchaeum sp. CG_4_10_14_0_8_um_filte
MDKKITLGLMGNPNCGKTSTFNALTGARQHVGNWPGKTVEKKEGSFKHKNYDIEVVDLPGTYSLTAYSLEELIARNYVVDEKPDVVVDIIDSTNLERNLYLAVQLIETGANVILAFNMADLTKNYGLKINVKQISDYLHVPIIEITARDGTGIEELKGAIINLYEKGEEKEAKAKIITYGKEIEEHLEKFTEIINNNIKLPEKYNSRWIALKLIENDKEVIKLIENLDTNHVVLKEAERIRKHLTDIFGEDIDTVIADARYGFIHGIIVENVEKKEKKESFVDQAKKTLSKPVYGATLAAGTIIGLMFLFAGGGIMESLSEFLETAGAPEWLMLILVDTIVVGIGAITIYIPFVVLIFLIYALLESSRMIKGADTLSDHLDRITTNRALGIPIFLLLMFITFNLTFEIGAPLSDVTDWFIVDVIGGAVEGILTSANAPDWLLSLALDGIVAGVGSVLVFVPFIFMIFLIIAILEDTGYLARAAFVMDKVMHKIGLHGKSFIPMLLGFGCNVPAIMATRVLENERDRILTILINPFMSCGARLPVYILFTAAFFTGTTMVFGFSLNTETIVIYSLYLLGISVAIIMGLIFKNTLFKGLSSPFVMELPPYRMPTLTGVAIHTWERGWVFIKKAGTVIFAIVVLIWFLAALPAGVEYGSEDSYIGGIGKTISFVFTPIGAGDWQSSVSLFFGFLAKEVVVGSMGVLYGINGETGLTEALQSTFTPLSAYAFLVFVLLYAPCMVAVATIKREIGWKWAIFAVFYTTAVAYIVALIVYQGGLLIGLG